MKFQNTDTDKRAIYCRRALHKFAISTFPDPTIDEQSCRVLTAGTRFFGVIPKSATPEPHGWLFRFTNLMNRKKSSNDEIKEVREVVKRYLAYQEPLPPIMLVLLSPVGPANGVASSLKEAMELAVLQECSMIDETTKEQIRRRAPDIWLGNIATMLPTAVETFDGLIHKQRGRCQYQHPGHFD